MVADIARVTYDPTRQYRSLIYQQGRVTLEADNNEAATLESEALRLETIDIIGPTGALGDGYLVGSGTGPGGITIGAGIFYLGGWRLELDHALGVPVTVVPGVDYKTGPFVVALLLTEQSVCAVEDQALREVALGGPDSAARSRLAQKFLRIPIDGETCAVGATTVAGLLNADGVSVDAGLQLISAARLQAGFVPGPPSKDACTPAAAGGYLGADNQMVRVTVTEYDATTSAGKLLWGWNNASLLYRVTVDDPLTLTLVNTPVDQEHAPQQNQWVEILRTEVNLDDGNYVAEYQGFVTSLASGYSFDSQEIVLNTALPAAYQNNVNPLFVRLWQSRVAFNAGVATALDNVSGITVAITMPALPSNIAARPFWRFAVRPATPTNIYPQRYADAPQPPDGPRQWITDLAVMDALEQGSTLVSDCRIPFLPLTQQSGGCCGLVLGPDEVAGRGGLQAVVDGLGGDGAVLSLRTGTYSLAAPLQLGKNNSNLTIEGCTGKVVLKGSASDMSVFRLGLVVINAASDITLRQLEFVAPAVPIDVDTTGANVTGASLTGASETEVKVTTQICIGVESARALAIEECIFDVTPPSEYSFGAAIMVRGPTLDVALRRNTIASGRTDAEMFGVLAIVTGTNISAELDHWEIEDNQFSNLLCALLGFAQLGLVRCCRNVVAGSAAGFVFAEANLGSTNGFAAYAVKQQDAGQNVQLGQSVNAVMRPDLLVNAVTKSKPIYAALPPPATAPQVSDTARNALASKLQESGTSAYKKIAGTSTSTTVGTNTVTGGAAAPEDAKAPPASVDLTNYDALDTISVGAELYEQVLTPALRIEDNEVTLAAGTVSPWIGIGVLLSFDDPGSVIVTGNRVVVPDATSVACGLLAPAGAVVTGNLFVQQELPATGAVGQFGLILITASPAIMVASNVVIYAELILPARASQAATTTWEFLNTTTG